MNGMSLSQRLASLPLRIKLIVALLISALAVLIVGVVAAVQYGQQPTTQILVEQMTRDRLTEINSVVKNASDVAASLANDQTLLSIYDDLNANSANTAAQRQVEESFRAALNRQPTFQEIRFVSLSGTVLASAPGAPGADDSTQPYFQALKGHVPTAPTSDVYMSNVISPATAPNIEFVGTSVSANPVLGKKALGYVVVNVDLTGAADPTSPSMFGALKGVNTGLGTVNFYLLDRNSALVSPVENPSLFVNLPENIFHPSATTPAVERVTSPLTGQPAFDFAVPVGQTGLILVGDATIVPLASSADAQRFLMPILLAVLACWLAIILVGWFLETTITRPAHQLRALARESTDGRIAPMPVVLPGQGVASDEGAGYDAGQAALPQHDELGQIYHLFSQTSRTMQLDMLALEKRVTERTRDVEATREIGQALSDIREIDPLLQAVANLIRQHFNQIQNVQVYLGVNLRVSTREGGPAIVVHNERISLAEPTAVAEAIVGAKAHVTLDTQADANLNTYLPGTRSELALPLVIGGEVLGALDLQSQHVDAFAESDVRLYSAIADQLAIAIHNAQLFEESRSRLAQIEELNRRLIGEGWRSFNTKRRKVLSASSGEQNGLNGHQDEWTPLQQEAILSGALVEQVHEDTVTFAVPISLRGEALGAAEVDVPRSGYTENTRQLARELAARLAVSADNARLLEESQRSAQREHLVNEIAARLSQQTNVEEILQIAVREIGLALHVPETSIRLATAAETSRKE